MTLSPRIIQALTRASDIQQQALERMKQAQTQKQEETMMQKFIQALEKMGNVTSFVGPQGPKGDTPIRGIDYFTQLDAEMLLQAATPVKGRDYRDGINGESIVGPQGPKGDRGSAGKDGVDGTDGVVDYSQVGQKAKKEANKLMDIHLQENDHTLLHDPRMIGDYELDEETLKEGDILQVQGKKLVGVKMPEGRGNSFWTASQGVSAIQSIAVSQSRELDTQGIYVIDATAGNITIALPSAAGKQNWWYEMIRIDSSANSVTINPHGTETIGGLTTYQLPTQWSTFQVFAYNGNYLIRGG